MIRNNEKKKNYEKCATQIQNVENMPITVQMEIFVNVHRDTDRTDRIKHVWAVSLAWFLFNFLCRCSILMVDFII